MRARRLGASSPKRSRSRTCSSALGETFGLAKPPRRIEVYDNSHIQGTNAVGAMIVAGPEGFRKNQYRKFNIKSENLTPGDDFGMMREVLTRRFKRLLSEAPRDAVTCRSSVPSPHSPSKTGVNALLEGEGGDDAVVPGEGSTVSKKTPHPGAFGGDPLPQGERVVEQAERAREPVTSEDDEPEPDSPWPDLVLIDGGLGQLTAARETLAALGVTDVPLIGIAKGPERDAGRETFFIPGREPVKLKPRDPVLYFVQRLRDEAHRFAIGSHRPEAQEGHPRSRPAGDPRHRPDAQARAAAPLRHPQGDRARLGRRPRTRSRHQRRNRAQDL